MHSPGLKLHHSCRLCNSFREELASGRAMNEHPHSFLFLSRILCIVVTQRSLDPPTDGTKIVKRTTLISCRWFWSTPQSPQSWHSSNGWPLSRSLYFYSLCVLQVELVHLLLRVFVSGSGRAWVLIDLALWDPDPDLYRECTDPDSKLTKING